MTTPTPGRWFYDEETATVHADREIVHNSDDWLVAFLISAETTPGMENRIPVEEMDANGFLMAAAPALLEAAKAAHSELAMDCEGANGIKGCDHFGSGHCESWESLQGLWAAIQQAEIGE